MNDSKMAKIYTHVESFAYGGALLNAMEQLTFYLNNVAEILEMRLAKRPLCIDGKPGETVIRLQTVSINFIAEMCKNIWLLPNAQGSLVYSNQSAG
ncbi:MAG: hypothetical protein R3C26_08130 [Calditrichia bacterium]